MNGAAVEERRICPPWPAAAMQRRADHVEAGVALLAEGRPPVWSPMRTLDADLVRPRVVADPPLAREGRGERGLRLLEDRGELVAGRVHLDAAAGRDLLAQEPADVADHLRVRGSHALDELGRPFDVGEEERDGACWQLGHAAESTSEDVEPPHSSDGNGMRPVAAGERRCPGERPAPQRSAFRGGGRVERRDDPGPAAEVTRRQGDRRADARAAAERADDLERAVERLERSTSPFEP